MEQSAKKCQRKQQEAQCKKRRRKAGRIALLVLVGLAAVGGILYIRWNKKRKKGMENVVSARIILTDEEQRYMDKLNGAEERQSVGEKTETDHTYHYRENVMNILVLGIDKETTMSERDPSNNSVGQADTIFVASLDLDAGELRLVAIPRDTMVTLEMYNDKDEYMGNRAGQLTLQYAYADGQEHSCELMTARVSEILGGIPIYGYMAMNLNTIPAINDAIGGVEVIMAEDYTKFDRAFRKGETVLLKGNQVLRFIQTRDTSVDGSAYERLMRQKTYLKAFASQAKTALKDDVQIVSDLLKELSGNFVTNLSEADILYLVVQGLSCSFSEEGIWVLPGEIQKGERYEEYYLDELAVRAGIIRMFYEEESRGQEQ